MIVRLAFLSLIVFSIGLLADAGSVADKEKTAPSAKQRGEEIDKLIKQLSDEDFRLREEATRQLQKRDDALPALQKAIKSDDAEVGRRARAAIEVINKRLGKRAIERAIAKLKKGQTDQFVDQVVRWRDYVGDDCWKAALEHAQAIADEAGKVNRCKYKALPRIDITKLKFSHTDHLKMPDDGQIVRQGLIAEEMNISDGIARDNLFICRGAVKAKNNLCWSVIFLNGDLTIGTAHSGGVLGASVVVCDGNVTLLASLDDSVILAAGSVSVGASVRNSVIVSGGEVKSGVEFPGAPIKNSLIQMHRRDPLNFIHFFDLAEVGIEVKTSLRNLRVEAVAAGKCFAQAGVHKGDSILAVDGVKVSSASEFRRLLRRRIQASNTIRLEIRREDKLLPVEVRFSEKSP